MQQTLPLTSHLPGPVLVAQADLELALWLQLLLPPPPMLLGSQARTTPGWWLCSVAQAGPELKLLILSLPGDRVTGVYHLTGGL